MDNIKISSIGVELDETLKNYINKKLQSVDKILDLNSAGVTGDIRLTKDSAGQNSGKIFRAEMSFTTPGKKYGVNADGNNLYEAIDSARDAVLRKITEYKGKQQGLLKRGGSQIKNLLKKLSK